MTQIPQPVWWQPLSEPVPRCPSGAGRQRISTAKVLTVCRFLRVSLGVLRLGNSDPSYFHLGQLPICGRSVKRAIL
jgi:hypothetical protein